MRYGGGVEGLKKDVGGGIPPPFLLCTHPPVGGGYRGVPPYLHHPDRGGGRGVGRDRGGEGVYFRIG